ncbi:MAG: 6-phosphogluconolactonase [Promethearchaeota archaeon]
MINRKEEVRSLMQLTPKEVIQKAGKNLIVCNDLAELHQRFAEDIAAEIIGNNAKTLSTRLILPIGPKGQYPILVNIINEKNISLENCWLFFMDEYCNEEGKVLSETHPLSFKRAAKALFLNHMKEYGLKLNQVFIPNQDNINQLAETINKIGGIDCCFGGIGIHGHIAFNEPEQGISEKGSRKLALNEYTITINAIRAQIGGNLENFPRYAYTLGMKEILNSRKIRLYCSNGTAFDWANTILRIALFGTPEDDYPVTHIRNHLNYIIITDEDTLATPTNLI